MRRNARPKLDYEARTDRGLPRNCHPNTACRG